MKLQQNDPPKTHPEIEPPVIIPNNPPSAPPEINPGEDPDPASYPPEIEPLRPGPEREPE